MKVFLSSIILFLSISTFVQAQNLQEQKADEYLNRYLELKRFNGTVLVANKQRILFNKGFGLADYEHKISIHENTKFCITGLTEQFTAYIALKVIEQQGFSLHSPVRDLVKDIHFKHANSITLHQLLSHTSRLPDFPLMHELPQKQFFGKEELVDYLGNVSLEVEPGSGFRHSKLNYNLVGLLLEKITEKPFQQLLNEYVTRTIGMQNTSLDNFSGIEENRAKGYLRRNIALGWENSPYLDPSNLFAAQGVLSTTQDLLLWKNFIRKNYLKDKALQAKLSSGNGDYGYGFRVKRNERGEITEIRSAAGYGSGFNSFSIIGFESDLVVVVLGNNRNPSSEDIADGLHAIFTNKDYALPLPRKIVKVDPLSLQKLAGDYRINRHVTISIMVEEGKVFVNDGMHPKFEIFPQSENQFFVEGADAEIVFVKNDLGAVTKIGLRNDGFTNAIAEKIRK